MVRRIREIRILPWVHIAVCLVGAIGCSGSKRDEHFIDEPPPPIILSMTSEPQLITDTQDPLQPWVLTVNGVVQIHATHPQTGARVDNLVVWTAGPIKFSTDPPGVIDQQGKYTAPPTPSYVGVAARADALNPPLRGSVAIKIVAAPTLISFTASVSAISPGQSVTLTPVFTDGQGQLRVGNQVIEANLVSGNPVTISPTTSTTYTLAVTNLAGASVTRDLAIAVN